MMDVWQPELPKEVKLVRVSENLYWIKGFFTDEPPKGRTKVYPTNVPGVYTDGKRIYLDKNVYRDPIENPHKYILTILIQHEKESILNKILPLKRTEPEIILKFVEADYIRIYYGLEPSEYVEFFKHLYVPPQFLESLALNEREFEELLKFWNLVTGIVKALEELIDFYKQNNINRYVHFVSYLNAYSKAISDDLFYRTILRSLTTFEQYGLRVFHDELNRLTDEFIEKVNSEGCSTAEN